MPLPCRGHGHEATAPCRCRAGAVTRYPRGGTCPRVPGPGMLSRLPRPGMLSRLPRPGMLSRLPRRTSARPATGGSGCGMRRLLPQPLSRDRGRGKRDSSRYPEMGGGTAAAISRYPRGAAEHRCGPRHARNTLVRCGGAQRICCACVGRTFICSKTMNRIALLGTTCPHTLPHPSPIPPPAPPPPPPPPSPPPPRQRPPFPARNRCHPHAAAAWEGRGRREGCLESVGGYAVVEGRAALLAHDGDEGVDGVVVVPAPSAAASPCAARSGRAEAGPADLPFICMRRRMVSRG